MPEKPKKRTKILKYIIFLQRALSYVILNVKIIENSADGRQSLWMSIKRECLSSNAEWRQKRKAFGDHAFVGSGIRRDAPLSENERRLIKEIAELRKANEILKDALGFSPKTGNGKAGAAV
ncbi:hypothetical protein OBV_32620 [Oscillibacter valericigenes Sjm18-20]|nr:hypothetical protein OBV_32620 [Oscillibacter valericigenes Sjm18-20]